MKRAAAKNSRPVRRSKRGRFRLRPPTPATWLCGGLLLLAALTHTSELWWGGAVLRELGLWLGLLSSIVALAQLGRRALPSGLLAAAAAGAALLPSLPFLLRERPTPVHGPELDLRHYHLGSQPPSRAALYGVARERSAQLLSFTFDDAAAARRMPAPAPGYRRFVARGAGERVLWVRDLKDGSGPSTLRVGGCSLALQHVALPSLFDLRGRSERAARLAALPRVPSHQPSVWLGHLGSSPAAVDVAAIARSEDMRDARVRHALLGTFPALFGELGLALDPLLLHGWIAVRTLESVAPALGGPYGGVHAVLELTEPRCARGLRQVL